jgi:hyaluronate lyase
VTLAVSDPTMNRDRIDVVIQGTHRLVTADEGVEVRRVPGGTRVRVATRQAYGRTFSATLR